MLRPILSLILICFSYSNAFGDNLNPLLKLNSIKLLERNDVEDALTSIATENIVTEKILNVKITDNKLIISGFKKLIGNNKSVTRTAFDKNMVKIEEKIPKRELKSCEGKNVQCLADIIFDNKIFPFQLLAAIKFRTVISTQVFGTIDPSQEEIKDIIKAFSVIPFRSMRSNLIPETIFVKLMPEKYDCSKKVLGELIAKATGNTVTLHPYWRCLDSHSRGNSIIHEVGHIVSTANPVESILGSYTKDPFGIGKIWTDLSNWKLRGRYGFEKFDANACYLSSYSKVGGPEEDFAETFMFYVLSPEYVEKKCPAKAEVLKNHIFSETFLRKL